MPSNAYCKPSGPASLRRTRFAVAPRCTVLHTAVSIPHKLPEIKPSKAYAAWDESREQEGKDMCGTETADGAE